MPTVSTTGNTAHRIRSIISLIISFVSVFDPEFHADNDSSLRVDRTVACLPLVVAAAVVAVLVGVLLCQQLVHRSSQPVIQLTFPSSSG